MTVLTTKAKDKSTYKVTAAFTDAQGTAVVPSSITWDLTNFAGTVVNSRSSVSVATPAASVDIILSGDDLDVTAGRGRILTVEAVYSSDEGNNLPLKDEAKIEIEDLTNV